MPALPLVSLTSTNADKTLATITMTGVFNMKGSVTPQTMSANTTSEVDFYHTCNIPSGMVGIITNRTHGDLLASPSTSVMALNGGVYIGDGTEQAIKGNTINPQNGTSYTLNSGVDAAFLAIITYEQLKSSIPNPW